MYGSHSCQSHVSVLRYSYSMRFESSLSLYQATLFPICMVATAVKAMCQYCSTVTVCDSNPHCHYIRPHLTNTHGSHSCQSHVPVLQYSYFMGFESSLSQYQSTLLPICTVATAVTISVHAVTNMYGSPSCQSHVSVLRYSYCMRYESSLSPYQSTPLPIYIR
jgi:hypothetical protein